MGKVSDRNTEECRQYLLRNMKEGITYNNSLLLEILNHHWGNTCLQHALRVMLDKKEIKTWQTHTRDRFYELKTGETSETGETVTTYIHTHTKTGETE